MVDGALQAMGCNYGAAQNRPGRKRAGAGAQLIFLGIRAFTEVRQAKSNRHIVALSIAPTAWESVAAA